ncbi:hypothetical protein, partial [Pseudomonas sp. FYR_5]|uniref:hypothetical protein n=1 Tax=Pseudomonas sp. FYR_5 TaxID=3367173 RepID=UPI00370AB136
VRWNQGPSPTPILARRGLFIGPHRLDVAPHSPLDEVPDRHLMAPCVVAQAMKLVRCERDAKGFGAQ